MESFNEATECYVANRANHGLLDEDWGDITGMASDGVKYLYYTVAADDGNNILRRYDYSVKGFWGSDEIAEEVDAICEARDGSVYYLCDMNHWSGDLYCDGTMIMSDVLEVDFIEDSDTLLVLSDYDEDHGSYTLRQYKNGKNTKVADDVYHYVALGEKQIALLADYNINRNRGELLFYNGKKTSTLDTDVNVLSYVYVSGK